jgi:hypothetical protein
MSIENQQAEVCPVPQSSEHLLTGLFTPGDKQSFTPADHTGAHELLEQNEQLIAAIHLQAERIAAAAVATLAPLPAAYQETFFQGISCFQSPDDVIYNSIRNQWNASDFKST